MSHGIDPEARTKLRGPTARLNLEGRRFGHWLIIARAPNRHHRSMYTARCDCGNERVVVGSHVYNGASSSCGCSKPNPNRSHGLSGTPEHRVWVAMNKRCNSPYNASYPKWGGRGIRVCDRWRSFEAFLEDMGPRPPRASLGRIDNDGDYDPGNCRWETAKQQCRNTRRNVRVTVDGQEMALAEAVEKYGGVYGTVRWRMSKKGMSIEDALGLK